MNKFFKNVFFYLMIIVLAIMIIEYYSDQTTAKQEVNYTNFIKQVEQGEISQVTIKDNNVILGKAKSGADFTTVAPKNDFKLIEILNAHSVEIKAEAPPEPPWWSSMFSSLLPILLLVGIWFFIMNQGQGGGNRVMSFGKSRAKMYGEDRVKTTFADVAGADECKQELEEVVEFLKHPKKFNDLGARIPKGVLLSGSPGTGKTLLAKAVAGEAGVPFFSISGSDFVEMFVGVGASRVRDLFEQAKKSAPCIVFIDEIDAVGRQRGSGVGGGHDEREQTLNQLLVEMDGFGVNEGIIIIAATNRKDILDPALLRPGRFDRQIIVASPDVKGREEILKVHVKGKPLDKNADLSVLARSTPGFTGADLSNLVNEAALLSARHNKKTIEMKELEEAIERVIAGPERKSRVMSETEKKLTAFHEAGHALIGLLLEDNTDTVHKVSIIPRGSAGGYTMSLPKEDKSYYTRSHLLNKLRVLLGGRVAEQVVLGDVSTGASNDLQRMSALARSMICDYGMSEKLGPITFGNKEGQMFLGRGLGGERDYGEEVASEIDSEVKTLIEGAYADTEKLLRENIDKLHIIAEALLEKETLEASELVFIMENGRLPEKSEEPTTDAQSKETPKEEPENDKLEQSQPKPTIDSSSSPTVY